MHHCSKWGILQNINLDKRGDFIVPSSFYDQLYVAPHKQCESKILPQIYLDKSFHISLSQHVP